MANAGLSVKAKGKRKVVESESDEPSSSKRRKDREGEEEKEKSQYKEWLKEVQLGMRIADHLGGVDPYKWLENLEREVIWQGELLSSIFGDSRDGNPTFAPSMGGTCDIHHKDAMLEP